MKKVICSYGDKKYYKSLELLEKSAYDIGKVDAVCTYTRTWLETTDFYIKNKYILDIPRGNGVWIWKPYIILKTFEDLQEGDSVIYSDAGLKVIDNLTPLYEVSQMCPNDGIVIFKLPPVGVSAHIAKTWTKRDCFILTNANESKYWNANMTNGAVSVWIKNNKTIEFLKEWQRYLRDPRIVTDEFNIFGQNFPEFKDHRHDQSVLTILSVKYNFELFRDPTQYGNGFEGEFVNSPYKQLFYHHRGDI